MHDLIRSPLQLTQPMTNEEWQELVLRASRRELQQVKRRLRKQEAAPRVVETRRRSREQLLNRLKFESAVAP